jgi:hypothetical protein
MLANKLCAFTLFISLINWYDVVYLQRPVVGRVLRTGEEGAGHQQPSAYSGRR